MKTCSFFGHRNTPETRELLDRVKETVISLITEKDVRTFLFGSKSAFDDLCVKTVYELKKDFPDIKLVYVRSHFKYLSNSYKEYLLKTYDDTVIPDGIEKAGKASYVERNGKMIDLSDYCVFYYDGNYIPPLRKQSLRSVTEYTPKSGTAIAYEYAKRKSKTVINLFK